MSNKVTSARVYFSVNGKRLFRYSANCCMVFCNISARSEKISDIIKYTTVCYKNINKQILNSSRRIKAFLVGITILNQKIIYKDDIKIDTECPCLLGHPVSNNNGKGNEWDWTNCDTFTTKSGKLGITKLLTDLRIIDFYINSSSEKRVVFEIMFKLKFPEL